MASKLNFRVLALGALMALSACGSVHWQKPGASSMEAANDQEACRKEAQAKYGSASALPMPNPTDPRFGPMGPSQADMRMQEAQAAGACMRKKGYVLEPDK